MGEILREDINIDGMLLALNKDEISRCVPFKPISLFFILQQILAPWLSGKKIDLTLYEVFKTVAFCIPRLNYALKNYAVDETLIAKVTGKLFKIIHKKSPETLEQLGASYLQHSQKREELLIILKTAGEDASPESIKWNLLEQIRKKVI